MGGSRPLGPYRIIADLGHGGMARVSLALVEGPAGSRFAKLAVLKRLRENLVEDAEFMAMLVDEARITARINHPNVVHTFEVGIDDNQYFIAMEYLDGQPLHRIQRRAARLEKPFTREMEYFVFAQALAGLHYAHRLNDYDGTPLGIVHRDVNPQNVFVTYEGQVKVVDFGIAKARGRAAETRHGIVKGKIRYMSPEQASAGEVDARSDVFAVGILLWETATRKKFWDTANDLDIAHKLLASEYEASPRAIDPTVPEVIDAICRKALAHSPFDRYESAAELAQEVENFLGESILAARRELGPLVAEMFDNERKQLAAIVERASQSALSGATPPPSSGLAAVPRSSGSWDSKRLDVSLPPPPHTPRFSTSPVVTSSRPPKIRTKGPRRADVEKTELSLLAFIPRKRRFGAGALAGAAMMFGSFLLALVSLQTLGYSSVAPALRTRASPVPEREPLVLASPARLREDELPGGDATPMGVSHAHGTFHVRPGAPAVPPAILPPVEPAPILAPTAPFPTEKPGRRRPIDMHDPWTKTE